MEKYFTKSSINQVSSSFTSIKLKSTEIMRGSNKVALIQNIILVTVKKKRKCHNIFFLHIIFNNSTTVVNFLYEPRHKSITD